MTERIELVSRAKMAAEIDRSPATITRKLETDPTFPKPVESSGQLLWRRDEWEQWKASLPRVTSAPISPDQRKTLDQGREDFNAKRRSTSPEAA